MGMPVTFEKVAVGSRWEREQLARLWGYESFHALARGVFTPANDNKVLLFVSEEKPSDFTQYEDRLSGRQLVWDGEKGHQTDKRIASADRNGDEIHVFYRKKHRDLFTYVGRFKVLSCELLTDQPSRFRFELLD
jgi:hypothetical protein